MRTFTLLSLAVFLVGSSTGPTLQGQVFVLHSSLSTQGALPQPPRDRQQALPTGTAIIRGRVVSVDTGQPLRRVQIRATAPELKEQRLTTTDEQGRFELKELPTGRYSLSATKGGYVTLQYGQRRPLEPGRPIELANGQVLDKVDFNLPRGSAITGRILDEFGESVTGARVQVLRYRFVGGQRRPTTLAMASTDDLGQFRAFGLPPGDYYVSAVLQMTPFQGQSDDRAGYSSTYYPGTPSISDAQRVTVNVGQEVSGIAFSLMPSRTAAISGVILDSSGTPVSSATIIVQQSTDGLGMMMTTGGQSRPDGSFKLSNVTPGEYVIQARPMNAGPDSEMASAKVSVTGEDISGLTLVTTKGVIARGQIVFDDDRPAQSLKPSEIRVFPVSQEPIPIPVGRLTVQEDWSFELSGLRGEGMIRAAGPPGWSLKAVRYESNDVTDSPIDFGTSGEIAGIQIVLTQQQTDISGMVTDSRGNVVKDYVVVMFAEDSARWGFQTRFIRSGRPDQDGRFKIRGLPPERYLAVAVDYLEPGEETNPETLEQLKPLATSFGLKAAEARALDLKLSKY